MSPGKNRWEGFSCCGAVVHHHCANPGSSTYKGWKPMWELAYWFRCPTNQKTRANGQSLPKAVDYVYHIEMIELAVLLNMKCVILLESSRRSLARPPMLISTSKRFTYSLKKIDVSSNKLLWAFSLVFFLHRMLTVSWGVMNLWNSFSTCSMIMGGLAQFCVRSITFASSSLVKRRCLESMRYSSSLQSWLWAITYFAPTLCGPWLAA